MCPECKKPLYGSASRGRHGGYYPAYHCDNRGHYFRKIKKELDATIEKFVKNITVAPEYIDTLISKMGEQLDKQLMDLHKESVSIDLRIANLREQIHQSIDKIKYLSSPTAIKYMEEDIESMENEIADLNTQRNDNKPQKPSDTEKAMAFVKYFLENLDSILLNYDNPMQQARYFGVLFNEAPTNAQIESGTPNLSNITGVNSIFRSKTPDTKLHGWVQPLRWKPLLSDL